MSLWAAASLICSLAVCPPLCLIGPALGLVALARMRHGPAQRGRGLAIAGISVGLAVCLGWLAAGRAWHVYVRRPLLEGPRAALRAGFAGDVPRFRAAFVDGGDGDDLAAAAFIAELRRRYGAFVTTSLAPAPEGEQPKIDWNRPRVRYRIEFGQETVDSESVFVIKDPDRSGYVLRFAWLLVHDPVRGDLGYPTSSASATPGSGGATADRR